MERLGGRWVLMAACVLVAGLCAPGQGTVIYVDDDANGANNGSSWANAFTYLRDALAIAQVGDEIRVAQGVYKPDRSSAYPAGSGDRNAGFHLLDGVAIKGGFAGASAADPNARDIAKYETVLSGDLAGDDIPVIDPCDLLAEPTRAENSYHVVTAEPCGRSAVLDGFTIRSGKANALGGGLYLTVRPCLPSVRHCTFIDNSADASGGAVCVWAGIEPELLDCMFLRNAAAYTGGAMVTIPGRSNRPETVQFVVRGCTFAWNFAAGEDGYAPGAGGAINIGEDTAVAIEDCTFLGNTTGMGGAICSQDKGNIVNCRFIQNVADEAGGAIFIEETETTAISCTFFGNVAPLARACHVGGGATLSLYNSILWDGGDEIGVGEQALAVVAYSDVQGGWPGDGNIHVDPLFAMPGYWDPNGTPDDPNDDVWVEGDYHLKSQAGRWDPISQGWTIDEVTSPCIDAGDPNCPIGLEPFPNGGRINMGAYGGTAEASKSPVGDPAAEDRQ